MFRSRCVLFVLGFALASPGRADVVTDLGALEMQDGRGVAWLYFGDDRGVTQARCASPTGVHDRNTCQGESRTVESNGFITKLLTYGPNDLEELAARVRDQLTRVDRVDLRIQELLNTPADDAEGRRLEAALQALQRDQATLETNSSYGEEQARQIRERLRSPSADPDLARQLAQVEATNLDLRRRIEALTKERNTLTVQLIQVRSEGPTSSELQELNRWRSDLVAEWENAQTVYLNAVSQASAVRTLVRHLTKSQDMFALELLSSNGIFADLRPYARNLDTAFEKAAVAEGHVTPNHWYVLFGRGDFFDKDDPERFFTISGWEKHYSVRVSRVPDLKQQCFDSVDYQDLDYGRFLAAPVELQCTFDDHLDYYSCRETRDLSNPSGSRILHRELSLSFVNRADEVHAYLQSWEDCYMGDGRNSVWEHATYHVNAELQARP